MRLNAKGQLFMQIMLQSAEDDQRAQRSLVIAHANAGEEAPFFMALLQYERAYRLGSHLKLLLYETKRENDNIFLTGGSDNDG